MTQTRVTGTARILAFASLLFAVIFMGSLVPAMGQDSVDEGQLCRNPEGSWLYTVTIPNPGAAPTVFLGTETYDAGGGYSEADLLSVTPYYLATAGHGVWKSTAPRDFLLTYLNLTYDANGNATGSGKVRQTTKMERDCKSYIGSGDFFYYDLNGDVVAGGSGTFTITAKRIIVQRPE